MAAVTVDATARNSYYSAGNIGWSARSAFAYCTAIQQLVTDGTLNIGNVDGTTKWAQSFTPSNALDLVAIRIPIQKAGSPTDTFSLQLWSDSGSNQPGSSLASPDNSYSGTNLSTTTSWLEFNFSTPVSLSASTKYWFVLSRSTAVDATNYYRIQGNGGSAYAGGGRALYTGSTTTWGAESSTTDACFQIIQKTPSALYQVTQDTGASPKLHMWKSTDAGANWTEQDSANAPAVNAGTAPFDACDTRSGPYIGVAYFVDADSLRMRAYDMSADTWGSDLGAADASGAVTVSQERSVRVSIDNVFTTAAPGNQFIKFTSLADDADLLTTRRIGGAAWSTTLSIITITSTEASLVAADVVDKAALGYQHDFYYNCNTDTFNNRTLLNISQGTATAVDSTAADVETEHASACYQIYQASGVDTIVVAYIDADGSIQERIITLEAHSQTVSMASENAVGTATTTAGRQLATCSYGGTRYIVASVSGTGIDYYTSTVAGTWSGPTNWKTGLTSSSISNVLSIEGYGLLVTYTDNGDVKVDWIVAPAAGDVTATISAGSLSVTGVAMTATTGVVATVTPNAMSVTGVAVAGTVSVTATITPNAMAVSGQAIAATTGVVATVTPNAMAVSGQAVAATTGAVATISPNAMSVTGQTVSGLIGDTGTIAAGALSTTGQTVSATTGTVATIAAGALATTGQTVTADPGVTATIAPNAMTVTGVAISATTGTVATISPDALAVTGQTIAATTGTVAVIDAGALAVTGQTIDGAIALVGTIASGALAVTGQPVSADPGVTAAIASGTLAVSGQAVTADPGVTAAIATGTLSVSGQPIAATTGTVATVTTGTLAVTGQTVAATTGTSAVIASGVLSVTGQSISADPGVTASLTSGALSVTGQAVDAVDGGGDQTGVIAAGALSVTGNAIAATTGTTGTITTGSLSVTGQAIAAAFGATATVGTGAYSVTGQTVIGAAGTTATIDAGGYFVTGQTVLADPGTTGSIDAGALVISGEPVTATYGAVALIDAGALDVTGQEIIAIIGPAFADYLAGRSPATFTAGRTAETYAAGRAETGFLAGRTSETYSAGRTSDAFAAGRNEP